MKQLPRVLMVVLFPGKELTIHIILFPDKARLTILPHPCFFHRISFSCVDVTSTHPDKISYDFYANVVRHNSA